MAIIREIQINKKVKRCVDYGCVWNSCNYENEEKYENGCIKFTDLQTCIERNGRMTEEEARKKGLI